MKFLSLEMIKENSRILGDSEDAKLTRIGNSAEAQVLNDVGRTYDELMHQYGEIPDPIIDAALMLVDARYQQPSSISTLTWSTVPYGYEHRLKPYMRLASRSFYNEDPQHSSSDI